MGGGAKNPRFREDPPADARAGVDERRRGADRRDPGRAADYTGVERRRGPRRSADLARPLWHRLLAVGVAIGLGVAAGLALGSVRRQDDAPVAALAPEVDATIDPELLAAIQSMRDEAEALTPAGVALDEQSHELWMPRVAKIELALADPETPREIRTELDATLVALERVGVLQP